MHLASCWILIETYWNVNSRNPRTPQTPVKILIETYWNVNYRDKDNEITVKCGYFLDKIDKFLEKVTETHGDSNYALVCRAAVEAARLQIDLSNEVTKDADE